MPGAERHLLLCVGDGHLSGDGGGAATAYRWSLSHLFEQNDALTVLACHVASGPSKEERGSLPAWPWRQVASEPFRTPPLFVAVTSSSSVAESVAAFAASQRPPPRLLLLGSRPPSALFRSASRSIVHAAPVPALVVPRGCASSHTHQAPSHTHHHNHHHKSPEWVATQHLTGRLVCIAVDASSSGPALCAWAAATLLRSSDRVVVVHARPAPRAPAHAGEYDLELNDALGAVRCALRALETTGAAHAAKAGVEPLAGGGAGGGAGTWDGGTTRASAVSSFVLTPPVAKRGSGSSDNESDGSGHGGGGSGGGGKGGAAESIVNWADSSKPTMLVVGSSSRTKGSLLERLSAGSVSSLVLQRAKCPVLVVDPATLATFAKR